MRSSPKLVWGSMPDPSPKLVSAECWITCRKLFGGQCWVLCRNLFGVNAGFLAETCLGQRWVARRNLFGVNAGFLADFLPKLFWACFSAKLVGSSGGRPPFSIPIPHAEAVLGSGFSSLKLSVSRPDSRLTLHWV